MSVLPKVALDYEIEQAILAGSTGDSSPTRTAFEVLRPEGLAAYRATATSKFDSDETLGHGGQIEFEDIVIPGLDGNPDVPGLLLRPVGATGELATLCLTHCGGKVISGTRMFLSAIGLLDWVVDYKIALVVAAVRVGPEDPHPAQVEDGYAALVWTHANARVRRFDPKRIGLLGFSGGGGVAAATALYSRDHGGPHVSNLVLVSPMMDDREVFQSSLFEDVMWPRESNRTGWWAILGDKVGGPDVSPYAAPSRAMNLDRMPPTYLETGTADTFRDETIDFATRLIHTGVPVDLHVWAGVMHGSGGLKPDAIVARAGTAARLSYIQRFATHPGRDCSGLPSNAARLT